MNRSFVEENARERERLRFVVANLTDEQLNYPLGNDWTIAVALAHLAFWDQRSLVLIRKWKNTGVVSPSPIDIEVTNDSLQSLWRLLPPRKAANLSVLCAESIDRELEEISGEMIVQIESLEGKSRVYRSIHRKMHLDQIEELINKKNTT
jgi:DinB superfamily